MKWLLLAAIFLAGCDEVRALRVVFADWGPALQSVDLWMNGTQVARLNKATLCAARVGAWCADHVRLRLASGRSYEFTVVGTDRYGRRLPSNPITYTQP